MVVGFTTTYAISAYHHWCREFENLDQGDHHYVTLPLSPLKSYGFESRSSRGVLYATLCDKVCQWLTTGRWFSPGTPVSSTNKTDIHDTTEILLKVALSTITIAPSKHTCGITLSSLLLHCCMDRNLNLNHIYLSTYWFWEAYEKWFDWFYCA
jgi:hypothetical protein